MKRILASLLIAAAAAAHAQIATGSATVGAGENTVFPEQQFLPGLMQEVIVDSRSTKNNRRELGPMYAYSSGYYSNVDSDWDYFENSEYKSIVDGSRFSWADFDLRDIAYDFDISGNSEFSTDRHVLVPVIRYRGSMTFKFDTTYTFEAEKSSISIDGIPVVPACFGRIQGTYKCLAEGWHDIEITLFAEDIGGSTHTGGNIVYRKTDQGESSSNTEWTRIIDPGDGSLLRTPLYDGVRVFAVMRKNAPTVMDVSYIVYTNPESAPTVNVRTLAFEDGTRSVSKIVRPETFIEDTGANIGDGIAANAEHRFSWKVSSDWGTDLSKVSLEVLAMKAGVRMLPNMHFVILPASSGHPQMSVLVNPIDVGIEINTSPWNSWTYALPDYSMPRCPIRTNRHEEIITALLWCYAGGDDPSLMIENGVMKWGQGWISTFGDWATKKTLASTIGNTNNAEMRNTMNYLFSRMGYRLLIGDELTWVNETTRLNLQPSGFRQYAVKTVEE